MVNYAFLNNENIVENILVFDSEVEDMSPFLESQNLVFEGRITQVIKVESIHKHCAIGAKFENNNFTPIKPHNSWMWDDLLETWIAPVPHPMELNAADRSPYLWNEESLSWEPVQ